MDKEKITMALIGLVILSVVATNAQETFVDITKESGIDHQFKVYEGTFGGGAVVFDINNDGFEDLFITGGVNDDVLYLNNGNGTFKNIYKESGLEVSSEYVTQGATSADVNKDGFRDLFITTINTTDSTNIIPRAKNLLFLNNGDLTFKDVTTEYGLSALNSFSTGACFGDVNEDGYPDLYIGNYFKEFEGKLGVIKDATIVSANQTSKDYLLINEKGKYFNNKYEDYGLDHTGFGFGGIFTDFDRDGDQDILVNNDFGYKATPNLLYENRFFWKKFKNVAKPKNMDLPINAMAAAVGDYDNDGSFDYFVTNIKFNRLMRNMGNGTFEDKAKETGAYSFSISWGANFTDFDHDGDMDIYVSNGDLNPNCMPLANFYYENREGKFVEVASMIKVNDPGVGRGSVVFDLENDGDMDILVVNQAPIYEYPVPSVTKLFRNDMASGNWLKVALKGTKGETNGIGSRIEVFAGNTHMVREIDGGNSSHLSHNSTVAHFGLGDLETVDKVIVTWVGGKEQVVEAQKANQLLTITESAGGNSYHWWIFCAFFLLFLIMVLVGLQTKRQAK